MKKAFLEISQNSQKNTCARVSFLIKLQTLAKETLAQVFSCEFCGIFKNTSSYRTPLVAALSAAVRLISRCVTTPWMCQGRFLENLKKIFQAKTFVSHCFISINMTLHYVSKHAKKILNQNNNKRHAL